MLQRLESYITQVITHFEEKFPGVVYCWDVVNEAVGEGSEFDPADPRHIRTTRGGVSNVFYDTIGSDYVEYAFLYARSTVDALGADIRLFYNDYNTFYAEKRDAIIALTRSINSFAVDADGNPRKLCDGVGMQGYIGGYGTQVGCMNVDDLALISTAIKTYAAEGLEVQLTEMAVRNFDAAKVEERGFLRSSLQGLLRREPRRHAAADGRIRLGHVRFPERPADFLHLQDERHAQRAAGREGNPERCFLAD